MALVVAPPPRRPAQLPTELFSSRLAQRGWPACYFPLCSSGQSGPSLSAVGRPALLLLAFRRLPVLSRLQSLHHCPWQAATTPSPIGDWRSPSVISVPPCLLPALAYTVWQPSRSVALPGLQGHRPRTGRLSLENARGSLECAYRPEPPNRCVPATADVRGCPRQLSLKSGPERKS